MADALTTKSRDFYEYAGIKMTFSLVLTGLGFYAMDRLCSAGGQSKYSNLMGEQSSGDAADSYEAAEEGYGFAAFFYFLAALFFWGAAIYISPFFFG